MFGGRPTTRSDQWPPRLVGGTGRLQSYNLEPSSSAGAVNKLRQKARLFAFMPGRTIPEAPYCLPITGTNTPCSLGALTILGSSFSRFPAAGLTMRLATSVLRSFLCGKFRSGTSYLVPSGVQKEQPQACPLPHPGDFVNVSQEQIRTAKSKGSSFESPLPSPRLAQA